MSLEKKKIVLGITGGIAAFKAASLSIVTYALMSVSLSSILASTASIASTAVTLPSFMAVASSTALYDNISIAISFLSIKGLWHHEHIVLFTRCIL